MNKPREFDHTVLTELQALLGDRVTTSAGIREHHGKDESYFPYAPPDAVVFPLSTEEVRDIVAEEQPHVVNVTAVVEESYEITKPQHDELCQSIENAADLAELKRAYETAQSLAKRANDGGKRLLYASLKDERKDALEGLLEVYAIRHDWRALQAAAERHIPPMVRESEGLWSLYPGLLHWR